MARSQTRFVFTIVAKEDGLSVTENVECFLVGFPAVGVMGVPNVFAMIGSKSESLLFENPRARLL